MGEASYTGNAIGNILKSKGLGSIVWDISKCNLWSFMEGFGIQFTKITTFVKSPTFEMGDATWSLEVARVFTPPCKPFARIQLLKLSSKMNYYSTCQMIVLIDNKVISAGCKKTCKGDGKLCLEMDIKREELFPQMSSDAFKVQCNFFPEFEEETPLNLTNEGVDILSSHMKDLFLKGENCDFVIKVKDRDFRVHKTILSARSPVLSAMLQSDMAEKNSGTTRIEDCGPDVFERFLLYLYSGQVEELSWENVTHLYTLGDKYDLPHLRKECLKFMKGNITVEAFCDAIALAVKYNESTLVKSATDFYLENVKAILATSKWLVFLGKNPTICNELFMKYAQGQRTE